MQASKSNFSTAAKQESFAINVFRKDTIIHTKQNGKNTFKDLFARFVGVKEAQI
jgi:hypothetical protein